MCRLKQGLVPLFLGATSRFRAVFLGLNKKCCVCKAKALPADVGLTRLTGIMFSRLHLRMEVRTNDCGECLVEGEGRVKNGSECCRFSASGSLGASNLYKHSVPFF